MKGGHTVALILNQRFSLVVFPRDPASPSPRSPAPLSKPIGVTISVTAPSIVERSVAAHSISPQATVSRPNPRLASLGLWLRDAAGRVITLQPVEPSGRSSGGGSRVRYETVAEPGSYVLGASGVPDGLAFPPRSLILDHGHTMWSFTLQRRSQHYFRCGGSIVTYQPEPWRLATVLTDHDVDADAARRLEVAMRRRRYRPIIDLTLAAATLRRPSLEEVAVVEFSAEDQSAARCEELIREATSIAREAQVPAQMLRIGRFVQSGFDRMVFDGEIVVGFTANIARPQAVEVLANGGARMVEDLTDRSDDRLIFVVRFDDAAPETANAVADNWLSAGLLHWVEPNLFHL